MKNKNTVLMIVILMFSGAVESKAGSINDFCSAPNNANSQVCMNQQMLGKLAYPILMNRGGEVSCYDKFPRLRDGTSDPTAKLTFSLHVMEDASTGALSYTASGNLNGVDASVLKDVSFSVSQGVSLQLLSNDTSAYNNTLSIGAGLFRPSSLGDTATATRADNSAVESLFCQIGSGPGAGE